MSQKSAMSKVFKRDFINAVGMQADGPKEEYLDDSSDGEDDRVSVSSHDTDTELDVSGVDEDCTPSVAKESPQTRKFNYIGRNGSGWFQEPRNEEEVLNKRFELYSDRSKPSETARQATKESDCFNLFFDDEVLQLISHYTNLYIGFIRHKFARERDCKETDPDEIRTVLGLMIMLGVTKSQELTLDDVYDRNRLGIEIFSCAMSKKRLLFLMRCLRFDDINLKAERRSVDNLAPIRELFETFVNNCMRNYCLGPLVTVDEQLIEFRGRCKFRKCIPRKIIHKKRGIKLFALVDACNCYTYSMEIYAGQQPEGPNKVSNDASDILKRMVRPIEGSCRNVTVDNWFTSFPLAHELYNDKKLSIIGALAADKQEIPTSFLSCKNREVYSSMFAFQENTTLVSYIPSERRNILILSTMHHTRLIDSISARIGIPEIITHYKSSKAGVERISEMSSKYSTNRNSRRWPLRVFCHMLDVAALNAYIIFCENNSGTKTKRRDFLVNLGVSLVQNCIEKRSLVKNLPRTVRMKTHRYIEGRQSEANLPPRKKCKARCVLCPRSADVKTTSTCMNCDNFTCSRHLHTICLSCLAADVSDEGSD